MKKEYTKTGWKEIITTEIVVRLRDLTPFQSAGGWVDFCKRRPNLKKEGRRHCQRCGVKWDEIDPIRETYFMQTNKGNKIVCDECILAIDSPSIHSQRTRT